MTRPRYETAEDRVREAEAAQKFADVMLLDVKKLEAGHRADFAVLDNGVEIGYLEVKTRTCNSTTYKTYHVSKDKLDALLALAKKENKRAALIVQWQDRAGFIGVGKFLSNATFKKGGRWDRGDKFDVEQMAEVDINLFQFLD